MPLKKQSSLVGKAVSPQRHSCWSGGLRRHPGLLASSLILSLSTSRKGSGRGGTTHLTNSNMFHRCRGPLGLYCLPWTERNKALTVSSFLIFKSQPLREPYSCLVIQASHTAARVKVKVIWLLNFRVHHQGFFCDIVIVDLCLIDRNGVNH